MFVYIHSYAILLVIRMHACLVDCIDYCLLPVIHPSDSNLVSNFLKLLFFLHAADQFAVQFSAVQNIYRFLVILLPALLDFHETVAKP